MAGKNHEDTEWLAKHAAAKQTAKQAADLAAQATPKDEDADAAFLTAYGAGQVTPGTSSQVQQHAQAVRAGVVTPSVQQDPAVIKAQAAMVRAQSAAQRDAAKTKLDQERFIAQQEAAKQRRLTAQEREEARAAFAAQQADTQRGVDILNTGAQFAQDAVGPTIDRIASARTVGGIGLLVVILIILLFVVMPVNAGGDTRMKLIWEMLNGRADLKGRVTPTGATPGTDNSGGGFAGKPIPFDQTATTPTFPTPTPQPFGTDAGFRNLLSEF